MKKYAQISIVLGIFFLLVALRQVSEKEEVSSVLGNSSQFKHISPRPTMVGQKTQKDQLTDGEYIGLRVDAFYGFIQVKAIVSNGRLSDIKFLEYPNDNPTSIMINEQAIPIITSEAISAQNAEVDIVSGASDSVVAFRKSLANALAQAK